MTTQAAEKKAVKLANKHKREVLATCEDIGEDVPALAAFMVAYVAELQNPTTK